MDARSISCVAFVCDIWNSARPYHSTNRAGNMDEQDTLCGTYVDVYTGERWLIYRGPNGHYAVKTNVVHLQRKER